MSGRASSQRQVDAVSLILPYLFIGPYSATSPTSTFVTRHGITHVISVGKKPGLLLDNIVYLRLSIEDDPCADLSKPGMDAVEFIRKARTSTDQKRSSCKILVHCSAGISRSPAIVTFYLMHGCCMSLRRALGLVIAARPNACPNPGFISQLRDAEMEIRGKSSLPSSLTSLPIKKEERLALFRDHPPDDDPPVSLENEENPLDKPSSNAQGPWTGRLRSRRGARIKFSS